MCNLYAMTKSRDALRQFTRAMQDRTGNQPPMPGIFPDQLASVARINSDGERVIENMRWGFPPPPNLGNRPVTNVRNAASAYWHNWFKPEYRCLVPATSFCEYTDSLPKVPTWFALSADRPLFAFAGIWRPWHGVRKGEEAEHLVFSFLTTAANALVGAVHAKAMPVILTGNDCDTWLEGLTPAALALQRPAVEDLLSIVARGSRSDPAPDQVLNQSAGLLV